MADAIRALRTELIDAMRAGSAADLRFGISGVEIEFEVETTHTSGAEAGVRFWMINAAATGGASRGTTQRLTLQLVPILADSGEVRITSFVTGEIG